jgi:hypothetical protein
MRSDKQQMSYVPQTTEHVSFTTIGASATAAPVDITVPEGSIVEKIVVTVVNTFNQAGVSLDIGHKTDDDYFTPVQLDLDGGSAMALGNGTTETAANHMTLTPQMTWVAATTLPDRVIRFTLANATGTASTGIVYAYAVYRFPQNVYPTRVV